MHACKSTANEMWQACMPTKIHVGFIKTEKMLISKNSGFEKAYSGKADLLRDPLGTTADQENASRCN